jgi:hypothetical protein
MMTRDTFIMNDDENETTDVLPLLSIALKAYFADNS